MKRISLIITILLFIGQNLFSQPNQGSVIPTGKKFFIQSGMNYGRDNGGYWDIPGSPATITNSLNIQVWNLDGGHDRMYTLIDSKEKGFYEIVIGNTKNSRVDVSGGKTANGTNIASYQSNGSNSQRFLFHHLGNGRFKIYNRFGKALCTAGRKSANGTSVHTWDDHDGVWMEWHLIDAETKELFIPTETQKVEAAVEGDEVPTGKTFYIQSAMNRGRDDAGFWDLPGTGQGAIKKNAQMQVWKLDMQPDRLIRFKKADNGQYYKLYVGTSGNMVVDLAGGKTDNGTPAHIWTAHTGQSQDFYFKHLGEGRFKIYHRSGKILNLKGSKNDNGTKVHLWSDHNGIFNEWYFIDSNTNRPYIPKATKDAPSTGSSAPSRKR
ncbi:MAG: RICIN domain-containing protein [Bacteroidales bacterium]|nr:RICIN domain-containing protein [Bacteroidales bacterium]